MYKHQLEQVQTSLLLNHVNSLSPKVSFTLQFFRVFGEFIRQGGSTAVKDVRSSPKKFILNFNHLSFVILALGLEIKESDR